MLGSTTANEFPQLLKAVSPRQAGDTKRRLWRLRLLDKSNHPPLCWSGPCEDFLLSGLAHLLSSPGVEAYEMEITEHSHQSQMSQAYGFGARICRGLRPVS